MIIAHQPRRDDDIAFFKPIIDDMDVGQVSRPGCPVYVSAIAIVKIVITGYEKKCENPDDNLSSARRLKSKVCRFIAAR